MHLEQPENLSWNVVSEEEFRRRTRLVFEQVATMLTKSLGPYGATTILEEFGDMHFTKDGWNILKKLTFSGSIEQNILKLLTNISSHVVIKVGDGSTSSIIAANELLKEIEKSDLKTLRPKELLDRLQSVVEMLKVNIMERSNKINPEEDTNFDQIHRVATISTNGDVLVPDLIQKIYKQTGNPNIGYVKSKTNETHGQLVKGYETRARYIDTVYVTNEVGECVVHNPLILIFDHLIDRESHFDKIISPVVQRGITEGRRVVVMAPQYSKHLQEHIRQTTTMEFRSRGTSDIVYTHLPIANPVAANEMNDFSILTGGIVIRESDMYRFHDEDDNIDVDDFVGQVGRLIIGSKSTLAEGLDNINKEMYDIAMRDAKTNLHDAEENQRMLSVIDSQVYELRKRLTKLTCNMGIIHVGGRTSLEKTANFDLVEDAVRASESAYRYGYNIGGNLIIPVAIKELFESKDVESLDETDKKILKVIDAAFRNVFGKVIRNKYNTDTETISVSDIINTAVDKEMCFDLITDEYSAEVINPSYTDVEILGATSSIVSLIMSSNQYLTIRPNTEV